MENFKLEKNGVSTGGEPYFSIITVCYNAAKTIERTLKSVEEQTCKDFEYIVIDGASTDATNSIIEKYSDKITKYISEPDKGIYDAMNKGISRATGKYLFFLNADDFFATSGSLLDVKNSIKGSPDIVSCNIITFDENGEKKMKLLPLNIFTLCKGGFAHQACFAKRTLFEKISGFDISYVVIADQEWVIRALLSKCSYQKIECFCAKFFTKGFSGLPSSQSQIDKEIKTMRRIHNLDGKMIRFFIRFEKIFRGIIKFFRLKDAYSDFASKIVLRNVRKKLQKNSHH